MKDIVREYQERFRRQRQNLKRYTALMLALALITTLFVNWQLHSDGIAITAQYQCGEVEHEHTADCYEKVLVCGYEEGEPEDWNATMPSDGADFDSAFGVDAADDSDDYGIATYSEEPEYIFVPHEHTDDCYQEVQVLTCYEEEHEHTDDCFDPEDNTLICDKFEHTHDDSCYTTEYELVCGLEEGELVEELNPDYNPVAMFEEPVAAKPVVVEPVIEAPVHHHTEDCYEEVLVCPLPEHHHTVNCLADTLADVEDESEWLAQTDTTLSGLWSEDLLTVAQSQLGYEQSEKNFELDSDDGRTVRHYTRYGQWYGNPYGEWDVMFLSYCLNYAGIPQSAIPQRAGVLALRSELRGKGYLVDFDDGMSLEDIMPGDIVLYNTTTTETVAVDDTPAAVEDDSPDADIALLSMDSTDAAPQTEEQAVTIETVGIVSDVNYDAGTLTVISGDVDGKVAEVTLSDTQINAVIPLNSVQAMEDSGAETLEDTYFDSSNSLDGSSNISDFELTVSNGTSYVTPDQFKVNEKVHGLVDFTGLSSTEIKKHNYQVYMKLPESFKAPDSISGKLMDGTIVAGTYTFQKDASGAWYLVMNYDPEYLTKHHSDVNSPVNSHVEFNFNWDEDHITKNEKNTITLPNGNKIEITITDNDTPAPVKKPFSLKKESMGLSYSEDGKDAYITYKVTLTVNEDTNAPLTLTDVLANPANATFKYDGIPSIEGTDAPEISWIDGAKDNSKTLTIGKDDDIIKSGTYTITYKVKCENFGATSISTDASVKNSISIDGHTDIKDNTSTKVGKTLITKSGSSKNGGKEIEWTVTINGGDSRYNLKNEKFTDTIPAGLTLKKDTLKITKIDPDGTETDVVLNGAEVDGNGKLVITDNKGISYDLEDGLNKYKITYRTTVDNYDNLPINGKDYTNTGTVNGDSGNGSASDKVTIKPNVVKKKAEGKPQVDLGKNEATLNWTTTISVDGSLDDYKYLDYGERNWVADSTGQSGQNLMLQKILMETINVTDKNGENVTQKLKDANKITEYEKIDNGVNVGLFQIDFDGLGIEGPVTITYQTKVDMSAFSANSSLTIANNGVLQKGNVQSDPSRDTQDVSNKTATSKWLKKYVNIPGKNPTSSGKTELQVGQKLSWSVILNDDGNMPNVSGQITITDTLPDGLILDESSVKLDFNYLHHDNILPKENEDYYISFGTAADGRTTIKVTLNKNAYQNTDGTTHNKITLTYDTMLDPDKADSIFGTTDAKASHKFQNDASIEYNGVQEETSADVTVTRKVLGKEGNFDDNTGILSYTVKVNPTGADLAKGGDTLILSDKLIPKDLANRITLQSISVFEAELQGDTLVSTKNLGTLTLADKQCSDSAAENLRIGEYGIKVDTDGNIEVWTKIPNKTPRILVFNYYVNTAGLVHNKNFPMTNKVELAGKWTYEEKTTNVNHTTSGTINIGLTSDRLNIIKYTGSVGNPLAGATFEIEYLNNAGKWVPFECNNTTKFVTDATGQYVVTDLQRCTVYRLRETEAPAGYQQDNSYYYFCIKPSGSEWTIPNFTVDGHGVAVDVLTPVDSAYQIFPYYGENTPNPDYVPKGSLKVTKLWQDSTGADITDSSQLSGISVELTKHSKKAMVTFVGMDGYKYDVPVYKNGTVYVSESTTSNLTIASGSATLSNGYIHEFNGYGSIINNITSDVTINVSYGLSGSSGWFKAIATGDAGNETIDTTYDSVTLSKDNNWTYTWSDLETGDDVYYTLKEITADGYETSYKVNGKEVEPDTDNTIRIDLSSAQGSNVQIINKAVQSDYELPSTGGAGTTLYTAVGGAIALAALVCGVCQKRRRERRAH